MKNMMTKAVLGLTLGATALTVATPADAQRYRYDRYRHNNSGATVAAGIAGLAIGAALVSNSDRGYRDRWYRDNGYRYDYDDYYYRQRGYYPTNGYYAYQYRDYAQCRTEKRYDPYYGRRVRVRVCY